ncbi:hypothetical protein QA649_36775 [Bradyrhizobium sp. CB1717]|uniref:hypothetical protein n=1 Tax=Bradyrhizobium sp. CB1717 TaxID=3039154 RepID=UPI0024B05FA4|nr:hypothetical protein [Bradyrhizobium sp. CB1717]WFU23523.1 hypothetical protein QA649_36775 [Bradyrhizobium sp. CB1717]
MMAQPRRLDWLSEGLRHQCRHGGPVFADLDMLRRGPRIALARRGSATLLAKKLANASGVVGISDLQNFGDARTEIGNDARGPQAGSDVHERRLCIGSIDKVDL